MATSVKSWDAKFASFSWNGRLFSGYGQEMIRAARDTATYQDESGADGEVVVWATNDFRGQIQISLLQSSTDNLYLSATLKTSELTGIVRAAMSFKDTISGDVIAAPVAWIMGLPEVVRNKGVQEHKWTFRTNYLDMALTGSPALT